MRPYQILFLFLISLAALPCAAIAQSMPAPPATAPAGVNVTLSTTVEEGKKQLVATVTKDGKNVANATVIFGATRTFGTLVLGQDSTLDDGTAAIAFPAGLPPSHDGKLQLVAQVASPPALAGARAQSDFPVANLPAPETPVGRALWSQHAPLGLLVIIALLLAGAWGAYLFVAFQLVAIKRGAAQ